MKKILLGNVKKEAGEFHVSWLLFSLSNETHYFLWCLLLDLISFEYLSLTSVLSLTEGRPWL